MDETRISTREAALQLDMDANTLRKYARIVGIVPTSVDHDRKQHTYSADDLRIISERYADDTRKRGHTPRPFLTSPASPSADVYADLQRIVSELAARVARLEARERVPAYVPPVRMSEPVAPFSARPVPVLTRPLSYGLPEGLVSWRKFAQAHGLPESTVKHQIDAGNLRIVGGRWKVGNNYVLGALDAAGRRQFYQLWSGREEWRPCAECPHEHEEAAHSQEPGE